MPVNVGDLLATLELDASKFLASIQISQKELSKFGASLETTVLPFILRGVALLGMDSAAMLIEGRRALWVRIADDLRPRSLGDGITEVTLETLEDALDGILAGAARGRWVVRIAD